ncbi:8-oxo-dGTP pyrophosphatase MutT (NUDIX family) [Neisseria sp. HSC-16F19]|nr:NUDIX domain-containing protein [Neisseria sp. HSC-16F19]MCP2041798.1 8-oxo-dGTP pyrophosphatase MutT (NUDIX family) [Neisseria sp. HSC-16F19]
MSATPVFPAPLSAATQDALWHYIRPLFSVDLSAWTALHLNGEHLVFLNERWRVQLQQDWPHTQQGGDGVLDLRHPDWLTLADSLQDTARHWHKSGLLGGWRDEWFDVYGSDGAVRFALERAAFRPLGLTSRAVHINGLVQTHEGWRFWIARRSPFKAVDPDKLDNIVGGGIARGEDPAEALLREGFEEAGLPANLLSGLNVAGVQHSLRAVSRGLHRERLYVFDAVLPPGYTPENQDGEVAAFHIMSVDEITAAILEGRFMNDALLVTLDAFGRYGLLNPELPLARWLQQGRRGFDSAENV